jgi:hypothetical protein
VTLRTARVLLGERNAEIEAESEWEAVRGEVEEEDMLYPGPTAAFSPLSLPGAPLSCPARLPQAELACIYEFLEAYSTRWQNPRATADSGKPRRSAPYNAHRAPTGLGLLDLALAQIVSSTWVSAPRYFD